MTAGEDAVERFRLLHRRCIGRSARWWLEACDRVLAGNFSLESWRRANVGYLRGVVRDFRELVELLPMDERQSPGFRGRR